mmetsp:Transcript_14011/g.39607  ORF Transcript_14011/g.39607 Transcript_14011/m.39607 type:complete len:230 (-) Transcript_14011:383-1072(-)
MLRASPVYTMTWPGTFCEEKRCTKEPNYFTVHGLWPNYENGKWPAFCNSSYPFNVDEIEDILPTMNKVRTRRQGLWSQRCVALDEQGLNTQFAFLLLCPFVAQIWPDVLSSHNGNWLWSHEWSKHGTCAKPVLNGEHEYFSKALALYDVLNPTEVFIQNGIVPSNEKTYDLDTVLNVLVTSFGHTFQVSCQESGEDLFQIEYCLQKDFQGRSCGSQLNGNCKKEIRIPA